MGASRIATRCELVEKRLKSKADAADLLLQVEGLILSLEEVAQESEVTQ